MYGELKIIDFLGNKYGHTDTRAAVADLWVKWNLQQEKWEHAEFEAICKETQIYPSRRLTDAAEYKLAQGMKARKKQNRVWASTKLQKCFVKWFQEKQKEYREEQKFSRIKPLLQKMEPNPFLV